MLSEIELSQIINQVEFCMEGLEKNFWRLIKLNQPEIWESTNESTDEYVWVIALIGDWCIYQVFSNNKFAIVQYKVRGEIDASTTKHYSLENMMREIVGSRFKI